MLYINYVNRGTDNLILKSLRIDENLLDILMKARWNDDVEADRQLSGTSRSGRPLNNANGWYTERQAFDKPIPQTNTQFRHNQASTAPQRTSAPDKFGKIVVLRPVTRIVNGRVEYYLAHMLVNSDEIDFGDIAVGNHPELPADVKAKLGLHNLSASVQKKLKKQIMRTGQLAIVNEGLVDEVHQSLDIPAGENDSAKEVRQNRWSRNIGFESALRNKHITGKLTNTNTTYDIIIGGFTRHFFDRLDKRGGWDKLTYMCSIINHPLVVCQGVTKEYEVEWTPVLDNEGNPKFNEDGTPQQYHRAWYRFDRSYRFSSLFHSVSITTDDAHQIMTFQANSFKVQQALKCNWYGHSVMDGDIPKFEREEHYNEAFRDEVKKEVEQTLRAAYKGRVPANFDVLVDKVLRDRQRLNPANWETFGPEYAFFTDWNKLQHDKLRSVYDIEAAIRRGFLQSDIASRAGIKDVTTPQQLQEKMINIEAIRKFNEDFLEKITTVEPPNDHPYAVEYDPDIDPANFDIPLNELLNGFNPKDFDATKYRKFTADEIGTKPEHDALNLKLVMPPPNNRPEWIINKTKVHASLIERLYAPITEEQKQRIETQHRQRIEVSPDDQRYRFNPDWMDNASAQALNPPITNSPKSKIFYGTHDEYVASQRALKYSKRQQSGRQGKSKAEYKQYQNWLKNKEGLTWEEYRETANMAATWYKQWKKSGSKEDWKKYLKEQRDAFKIKLLAKRPPEPPPKKEMPTVAVQIQDAKTTKGSKKAKNGKKAKKSFDVLTLKKSLLKMIGEM